MHLRKPDKTKISLVQTPWEDKHILEFKQYFNIGEGDEDGVVRVTQKYVKMVIGFYIFDGSNCCDYCFIITFF